jgi:hypothetical protein
VLGKVRSSVWEVWGEEWGTFFSSLLFSVEVVGEGVLVSGLLLCGICFMIRVYVFLCLYRSFVVKLCM